MSEIRKYWNTKNKSGQRYQSKEFFDSKAKEHFSLIDDNCLAKGVIDLGCGAGEVLEGYLRNNYKVIAGMDFSTSMLDEARKNLSGYDISLFEGDVFKVLPEAKYSAWIATQSLNQYLPPHKLEEFIKLFEENDNVKQLALFDCVDFLRYLYMPIHGFRYDSTGLGSGGFRKKLGFYKAMIRILLELTVFLITGAKPYKFLGVEMGYGYLPLFWMSLAKKYNLTAEIYSSKFYEYRYHVVFHKNV